MLGFLKELRKITGLGITDCKNALIANGGDIEKSIEYLRKNGLKLSNHRSNRETSAGTLYAHISDDRKTGVIVEIKCETDFVAKMDEFNELARAVAHEVANLKQLDGEIDPKMLINSIEKLNLLKLRTKENIKIGKVSRFQV